MRRAGLLLAVVLLVEVSFAASVMAQTAVPTIKPTPPLIQAPPGGLIRPGGYTPQYSSQPNTAGSTLPPVLYKSGGGGDWTHIGIITYQTQGGPSNGNGGIVNFGGGGILGGGNNSNFGQSYGGQTGFSSGSYSSYGNNFGTNTYSSNGTSGFNNYNGMNYGTNPFGPGVGNPFNAAPNVGQFNGAPFNGVPFNGTPFNGMPPVSNGKLVGGSWSGL